MRHLDWEKAVICQFSGTLDKDGLCVIRPNFTISLDDPHLSQAFVVCVQIKDVEMLPNSVYATIASRCIFHLTNSVVSHFRNPYGMQLPTSLNRNISNVAPAITSEGFVQGFPAIEQFLATSEFSEKKLKKRWMSRFPEPHSLRYSTLQLLPAPKFFNHEASTSSTSELPPILPVVHNPPPSSVSSSPNRDAAAIRMLNSKSSTINTIYITPEEFEWPPEMAYTTTTPEQLLKEKI